MYIYIYTHIHIYTHVYIDVYNCSLFITRCCVSAVVMFEQVFHRIGSRRFIQRGSWKRGGVREKSDVSRANGTCAMRKCLREV